MLKSINKLNLRIFVFTSLCLSLSCTNQPVNQENSTRTPSGNAPVCDEKMLEVGNETLSKYSSYLTEAKTFEESNMLKIEISEIEAAIKNACLPPERGDFELFLLPIEILKLNRHSRIEKTTAHANHPDVEVQASTFWNGLRLNSTANLFSGFNRKIRNQTKDEICEYTKPKAGWGVHPGFHVACGDKEYKVKFGNELNSGPFNSRIFWSLGYNTPTIDYTENIRVKYNRRIFKEFNSRRIHNYNLRILGMGKISIENQKYFDPFKSIQQAVLNDGSILTVPELKARLLKKQDPKTEKDNDNYNADFEAQIDYLVFDTSSLTEKFRDQQIKIKEIGPWRFDDLDHGKRTEVRAIQILAAWVSNYDLRTDNNRLVAIINNEDGKVHIRHDLIDVGAGLGSSSSFPNKKSPSNINAMDWKVTRDRASYNEGGDSQTVELSGLISLEPNPTFRQIPLADAQWMVRNLCSISENQILQALAASGLSSAEARLGLEKMVSRRNNMVIDFDQQKELSFCVRKINKKLNYDPAKDGDIKVDRGDGEFFVLPRKNKIIRRGETVEAKL